MVRLLILGTGKMAHKHARTFQAEPDCEIVACADIHGERLAEFAEAHRIPNRFASLEDAIDWGAFDAVANVTPDVVHHPTTMAMIAAGKHIFCEKPLAPTFDLAREMADCAEAKGLVNMVNLTYRNAAALDEARALVTTGAIGAVRHVEASYLQSWLTSRYWGDWRAEDRWLWRLSGAHGSKGVLGDIGIHILDLATHGAASEIAAFDCRLKSFAKAEGERIGDYVLDANDSFVMDVEFENGALGVIHASRWATGHANDLSLKIYGTEGALELWADSTSSTLKICIGEDIHSQTWRAVDCPPVNSTYARFVAAVGAGWNDEPTFRRATELQRMLDLAFGAEPERVAVPVGAA